MKEIYEASRASEKQWLVDGVREGKIRIETAVEIMRLLNGLPTKNNDLPVYATKQPYVRT